MTKEGGSRPPLNKEELRALSHTLYQNAEEKSGKRAIPLKALDNALFELGRLSGRARTTDKENMDRLGLIKPTGVFGEIFIKDPFVEEGP